MLSSAGPWYGGDNRGLIAPWSTSPVSRTSLVGFGDDPYVPQGQPPGIQRGLGLIGESLRRARHRAGLSQRQLEEMSGVDQSTISKLENGRLVSLRLVRLAALVNGLEGLGDRAAAPARPPPVIEDGGLAW
jgi:DNA-binding XRE family transcriptional regulator